MANNLKRLASQRTDVFDDLTGAPAGSSAEEEGRRKKAATVALGVDSGPGTPGENGLAAPGTAGAAFGAAQKVNVEEQIARIHQKFANEKK